MLVINLYAGPSAGKSILAGDIYAKLGRAGVRVEIPPEVAKIRAQREDFGYLADQLAVFADTQHQLNMAKRSGAEVAVVDSPVLLSLVYAPMPYLKTFPAVVREVYESFGPNLEYFIKRDPKIGFSQVGRVHNEAQSLEKDRQILEMLRDQAIAFRMIEPNDFFAQCVVQDALKALGRVPAPRVSERPALRAV